MASEEKQKISFRDYSTRSSDLYAVSIYSYGQSKLISK